MYIAGNFRNIDTTYTMSTHVTTHYKYSMFVSLGTIYDTEDIDSLISKLHTYNLLYCMLYITRFFNVNVSFPNIHQITFHLLIRYAMGKKARLLIPC